MKPRDIIEAVKSRAEAAGLLRGKNLQLVINIAIILLVNIAGMTLHFRIDLTQRNNFSLTKKSKEVVSNLKESLKIRVLFSDNLNSREAMVYRYLKDLLEEYNSHGNENFSYEIVPAKDLAKMAEDYGIKPASHQELSNDQFNIKQIYMGLVIQQADLVEKIDEIRTPVGLEYSITGMIERMSTRAEGLQRLPRPMTATLYFDKAIALLPIEGIAELDGRIKSIVARASARNYGKINFRVVDPSQKQGADPSAAYGLPRIRWQAMTSRLGQSIPAGEGVLGLVLEGNGRFQALEIPVRPTIMGTYVVSGMENLEDRISAAVGDLVSSNPRIGYVVGHGEVDVNDGQTRNGAALLRQILSDMYELVPLDLSKQEIPESMKGIIVNGPRSAFADHELFKIDQYLMKGRTVIVFSDSFFELEVPGQQSMGQQRPVLPVMANLDPLLDAYGVKVNPDVVLDPSCAKVNLGQMVKDYPLVPIIKEAGLGRDAVITKYLRALVLFKASSVGFDAKRLKKAGVSVSPLVSSSADSWLMEGQINYHPLLLELGERRSVKSHPVAVLLEGRFDSAFRGKEAPRAPEAQEKEKAAGISSQLRLDSTVKNGRSSLIVIGTSEITRNGFLMDSQKILRRGPGSENDDIMSNGVFLHSLADYATGNVYVPEMQSKSVDYNPLKTVGTAVKNTVKLFNMFGIPVLVVLAGIFVWRGQRKRRAGIEKLFAKGSSNE